ncbi:MAG: acyl-CoA dehydratase activase-related protein, partial [Eggerthellaceae bacterium]|nr:acyl-CoA dehydratase activase-related protein [Eggerthellaceae bacterium]
MLVQGGAFKSDAILRAFEKITGKNVIRFNEAHLMGAIGAALIACERNERLKDQANVLSLDKSKYKSGTSSGSDSESDHADAIDGADDRGWSSLLSEADLKSLKVARSHIKCTGCDNSCELSFIDFGGGRHFISENKCELGLLEPERIKSRNEDPSLKDGRHAAHSPKTYKNGRDAEKGITGAHRPPDVLLSEQRLLQTAHGPGACADSLKSEYCNPAGSKNGRRIGFVNALMAYAYTPFWTTLLEHFGFDVVLPHEEIDADTISRASQTIPSESVCFPAKTAHSRYADLASQDIDFAFMPLFEMGSHCPVSCEYAYALKDNLPTDSPEIISPVVASPRPQAILNDPKSVHEIALAINRMGHRGEAFGAPEMEISEEDVAFGLERAMDAQKAFQEKMGIISKKAIEWVHASPERHGILVIGRPYHNDPSLLNGIDEEIRRLGFAVLSAEGLKDGLRGIQLDNKDDYPWKPAKHLLKAVKYILSDPQIDIVCLQSFGCGYDAVSISEARSVLEKAGRPLTLLKIDYVSNRSHMRIRLRTMAQAIEFRKGSIDFSSEADPGLQQENACGYPSKKIPVFGRYDADDFATAKLETVSDVCYTARMVAAKAIRLVRENPDVGRLILPEVCKGCLMEAVPVMIKRALGFTPSLEWEPAWQVQPEQERYILRENGDAQSCSKRFTESVTGKNALETARGHSIPDEGKPRIGILGNALLCFEPFMNDSLLDKITELGCTPVLPDPELIVVDDVRYLD